MKWRKDPNLRYTQLCMFVDENVPKIAEAGKYPDIENEVYNDI